MTFALIIAGLVFGGIMTIVTIVFTIINLANSRTNKALGWGAGFLVSLAVVLISVFQLVTRVTEKVKNGIDWAKEQGSTQYGNYNDDETRKAERQEWLDSLQLHNMVKYEDKVPADFYINKPPVKDSNGITTIPFLYPYLIRFNDVTNTGDLVMEDGDSAFVSNISQIAFDQNFAIIKVDNSQSPQALKEGKTETEYLLYDLRTRNYESMPNNEKLMDMADRIGYTGPKQMQYLSDACRGWIDYTVYD
ncbi:MAG TPA: hypothetical protein VF868_06360 [Bacteroidia bacterium]|jgi:hypothetical protein